MRYAEIYADDAGGSHFRDVELPFRTVEYLPGHPPLEHAAGHAVSDLSYLRLAPGWVGDWHCTPRSQFTLTLAGRAEVVTSDGERREFGPGELYLALDTTGRGHQSRVLGDAPWLLAVIPLREG